MLGPVRVVVAGVEAGLGPARQRAVFAVLATRAGQTVSRAELVEAVWGGSAPASADGNVYTYISGLRRALRKHGHDLIDSVGNGYSMRLAARQLDVGRFEELCGQAGGLAAQGDHRGVAETLGEALVLWRGKAFAGVPGPYAEQERGRLEHARLRAVEKYAAARLELGAHVEVAAELSPLVREHPLRESLRELLMLALSRSGRHAEALDVFADTRETLLRELGIEPGPALRAAHAQVLTGGVQAAPPVARLLVKPCRAATVGDRLFVGRVAERALLRERVAEVQAGRGGVVWIEGEAGIGKSELLAVALSDVDGRGPQLGWAVADQLSRRFPLRVVHECLGLDRGADQPVHAAVERICAAGPTILVIDDLHCADDASVQLWQRLIEMTRRLPLLLVTTVEPGELSELRRQIVGDVVTLPPLRLPEVELLMSRLVGGRPGRTLRRIAARAGGNPLYLREVLNAMIVDDAVEVIDGIAHVEESHAETAPRTLVAAVERASKSLPESTKDILRWVAVLGSEARVDTIATVSERPVWYLVRAVAVAVAADVLTDDGPRLTFRLQLMRDTVYAGIAAPTRSVLHRRAAKVLADAGASESCVAEQVVAAGIDVEPWVAPWLVDNVDMLSSRTPEIAADLLELVLDSLDLGDPSREVLYTAQVRVLFRLSRDPEAQARHALAMSTDPVRSAELRQLLAAIVHRHGRRTEAVATLTEAPLPDDLPEAWRLRHKALLAHLGRDVSDLDIAEISAKAAYHEAVGDGDDFLAAHALQTRWLVDSVRREHLAALRHVDEAIHALGAEKSFAGMRFDLLDNKMFTLQNLDRLDEADQVLAAATELGDLPFGIQVAAAVHHYWRGRWDEALRCLADVTESGPSITYAGLLDAGPAKLLTHGLSALIGARRGDGAAAAAHLEAAEKFLVTTSSERENFDFLLAARALAAVQAGDQRWALDEMTPMLHPEYDGMMLRHQWLPVYVRLAMVVGDHERAEQALAIAEQEAAREQVPARAFSGLHRVLALIERDPEPGLVAVDHYRRVGRPAELAATLSDVARLFAARGDTEEARAAMTESRAIFGQLGADWDLEWTATRRIR
ncbi:DNA-binding SARP family transcriptional activator [Actinocrispum wychmicini]|uniref:DNA-binding SARP family transcriptional activator n=1 Tax=Actinocrispum wychmicini TaxID=1213861 RepID=A0A4R2J8L2_9PSEU|nr:DNA-binding SARP family transcriptional activator [Actinocrispum wychmicini]